MAKQARRYIITENKGTFRTRTYRTRPLTVPEAVEYYGYTLEVGASWAHERGNRRVNQHPKTIDSLITALENATRNAARNGVGSSFSYELVDEKVSAELDLA